MSEEAPKNASLMDFEEEEEDDQNDLLATKPKASTENTSKKPSNSLMDCAEDEDEDEQDELLRQKQKKKRKMVQEVEEDDEEEEEEEEEESDGEERRSKRERQRSERTDVDEADVDGDDDEMFNNDDDDYLESRERIESLLVPSLKTYAPNLASKCYYSQLPRFLYIAGGAFDEDRYNFEKEKKAIKERNGEQLIGDEIIRWRVKRDENGNAILNEKNEPELESNAQIVEYDDGSYQLFVGEEAIDLKLSKTSNEFLYARTIENEDRLCLQALAEFAGLASFRPTGPESKQQKAIEAMVKKQQVRVIAMRDTNPTADPEQEQDKKIKEVDEMHRKNVRRRNRTENAGRRRGAGRDDWNTSYLEKDEVSSSRKKKTQRRRDDDFIDDEEEEEEEEEDEMNSFIASEDDEDEDDEE